jgi:hypothetical protein
MLAFGLEPILATSLVYLFAHARNLLLGQLTRLLGQVVSSHILAILQYLIKALNFNYSKHLKTSQ